jgi:hypothetical protein
MTVAAPAAGTSREVEAAELEALVRLYAVYALGFLLVTLLSGVWLRSAFIWPAARAGFEFPFLVHAHSHVAFFGWVTPALFALIVRAARPPAATCIWLRWHAHLLGAASVLAFVGFLQMGYQTPTIVIASGHVALWVVFAARVMPWLRRAEAIERQYYGAALVFLLIAGAGAMAPGVVEAKTITDPWLRQSSLQLFLTPFTAGWLALGAYGAVYALLGSARFARPVWMLTVVGALPAAAAHVTVAPPHGAFELAGRLGLLLTGAATLLFAADVIAGLRLAPLARLAGIAALVKGSAEVLAALGVGAALLTSKPLIVAYLHLALLGLVTPVLLGALVAPLRAARLTALHATGLVATMIALGVMGVPGGYAWIIGMGLSAGALNVLALVGGVMSLAALGGVVLLSVASRRTLGLGPSAERAPARRGGRIEIGQPV